MNLKKIMLLLGLLILTACSGGGYVDGKHIGSAYGERGVIMMEVGVERGYISSLVIKESYDDRTAVQESYRLLRNELIKKQSVDLLSVNPDHPVTSKAEIEAIRDALKRARAN